MILRCPGGKTIIMHANRIHIFLDIVFLMTLLVSLIAQPAYCQQTSSTQVVTLRVMELNKVDLVGGPLTLEISSVNDNTTQPSPSVDASTKLLWTSNGDARKIVVGSNIASPRFILKIEAQKSGSGPGIAEPELTLSDNEPHDLILGVERSAGSCQLRFTAIADAEQGIGTEARLITFTITGG